MEGEKVILNTFSEAFETDAPSENTSCPKSTNTIESDITDQMLRWSAVRSIFSIKYLLEIKSSMLIVGQEQNDLSI